MDISQNLKNSLLVEMYGSLLTQKQKMVLTDFLDNNISISEIAETLNTSRQAVNDLIKRTLNVLNTYEQKLKLLTKFNKIKQSLEEIAKSVDEDTQKKLKQILEVL